MQLRERNFLLGGQREIFNALFLGKARAPIERVDLIFAQDLQAHWLLSLVGVRLPHRKANFCHQCRTWHSTVCASTMARFISRKTTRGLLSKFLLKGESNYRLGTTAIYLHLTDTHV